MHFRRQVAHFAIEKIKDICYHYISEVIALKITINTDSNLNDIEITINCPSLTPETERLIAALRLTDKQIAVTKDENSYILDVSEIVYVEAVDRHTFVYTEKDVYDTRLKLYELEDMLSSCGFMRTGKSCLVQLRYIRSLRSELNRKLRLTLENGEQLMVSRQYADELKKRLGVK